MRIEYHRTLIADRVRNEALFAALRQVIVPGRTALADIGAGTGLIGLMASRLGAREVFLYEKAEVSGVAAEILKKNRARNCHLMPCHSGEMQDPPQVDVVVSETLGNYALEENIIETLADARSRHLKPGGVMIPARITQYVTPVISPRLHEELTAWDHVHQGLDLAPARAMSFNNVYVRRIEPHELLDGGQRAKVWDDIDLARDSRSNRKGEASWTLGSDHSVYGFAVWWEASLVPGVTLSTAPGAPPTHWEQLYFPVAAPIVAGRGETVLASLRSRTSEAAGTHLAWTAVHSDRSGKAMSRQAMDLDKGWIP
ncbi:MAG: 50S ribosomal protein L11 methyltransferase [Hyphomicrobium sp.]